MVISVATTNIGGLRLQTKFLLSMVLVSATLTFATLFVVRRTVQRQERLEIQRDLDNSVSAFRNFQKQREITLQRSASLLADLPNVRALMTTRDAATIQDASRDLWKLAGSDLLILADTNDKVMALQTGAPEIDIREAQDFFPRVVSGSESRYWWQVEGHLYEIYWQSIYFGPATENRVLGYLALGYEIDDRVAREVSRVAASEVAFRYGEVMARSTLTPSQEKQLAHAISSLASRGSNTPDELRLGDERFLVTSINLSGDTVPRVSLSVLKSFDRATAFLSSLNQVLLALGLIAVLAGSILVFLISRTFIRPLDKLVAGVRALEHGDYAFPLEARGGDEVAEVTRAFDGMRHSLQKTQKELIESERLATIGRMASSISHDLRHSLAAIVANAEFLCEANLTSGQREDLYAEIRIAVNQMTELIESLLEFSRTREFLHASFGDVRDTIDRAIQSVKAHPEFQRIPIHVCSDGSCEGSFDFKKLERAMLNLLLNACEAVAPVSGEIRVDLRRNGEGLEIRVSDTGPGIAEEVRGRLFEPFVSYGKENGTGMGLTVVQKILQDHGGDVTVEQTSSAGTVFKVCLPLKPSTETVLAIKNSN